MSWINQNGIFDTTKSYIERKQPINRNFPFNHAITMDTSFTELLVRQSSSIKLIEFDSYKNEFETIYLFQRLLPKERRELLQRMGLDWMASLQNSECMSISQSSLQSKNLREQGNQKYKGWKGEERDILHAAYLYTKAILTAGTDHESLALAYANRAMALQEFGYYREAYSDCICALDYGYPLQLRQKLLMRQAYCSFKLEDHEKLSTHVNELTKMKLNHNFKKQLEELKQSLDELQKREHLMPKIQVKQKNIPLNRHTQKIITSSCSLKGRYMVASRDIPKNGLIFTECASSFVPVGDQLICHKCAITQFIPISCSNCNGQVIYCSLECRQKHASVHSIECPGYRMRLFEHLGISHLAFRCVLDGLPQIMPLLQNKSCAKELWSILNDAEIQNECQSSYIETLRMITHLDKMQSGDIMWFALTAELLRCYLQNYTNYFEQFAYTEAPREDWELIVSSLILRSIGQLICNAHTAISIVPVVVDQQVPNPYVDFTLLQSQLWTSPYHVRLGQLHRFCDFVEVAAMNLPYLSICNHACVQSFQTKFNGNIISTYATKQILADEEITNCYTLDFRKSKYLSRRDQLLQTYHFKCNCSKCIRSNPDVDYEKFHRYRCEQSYCRKEFIPEIEYCKSLKWWTRGTQIMPSGHLRCSICKSLQEYKWLHKLTELQNYTQRQMRYDVYRLFLNTSKWLIGNNEFRLYLARIIIENCFISLDDGLHFESNEFSEMADILNIYLCGIAAQSGTISMEYVTKFTYLWDIIALGLDKYKPNRETIEIQLDALEYISSEYKRVFLNYYKDFVESAIK